MTEPSTDQVRELIAAAVAHAPGPHAWSEVERRAVEAPAPPSGPSRRPMVWLAAVATVGLLVAGVVVLSDDDSGTIRTDTPTTVSDQTTTTSTEPSPTTTVAAAGDLDEESAASQTTVAPSTSLVPEAPGGDVAGPLGVPQPGETQQTVIGDIVWTLLEGDASTQPEMVSAVIDGVYYGVENGGQGTWRSPDGIEWELTDLTPNGIVGIFEIDGESWARRSTLDGQGLGRWNGEEFAPVELPTPLAPQIEGLRSMPGFAPNPVQVGDEWIVPVTTRLAIPWNEWYPAEGEPEWDVVTETIRIMDYSSGAPTPLAVIDVDVIASDPARIEFRDSETDEVVVDVVVPAGDDPEELRQQLVAQGGSSFHELLIGDGNGFEAVASPSPFAESLRYAVVGDTVLAVASYPFDQQGRRSQPEELWASTDGRNWERRELPTPSGSRVDWVDIAADGSVALLTIVSGDDTSQGSEAWSSVDGLDWVPTEEDHGFDSPRPTELGWLRGDLYETGGISVSSDGLTWQSIDFDVRPPGGPGGGGVNVFGDTIFVATHERGERTMWVGKIVDR